MARMKSLSLWHQRRLLARLRRLLAVMDDGDTIMNAGAMVHCRSELRAILRAANEKAA